MLHINASYKPAYIYGGPTMSVAILCEQLNKAGIVTDVFTTTANGKTELPVVMGQPVNVDGVQVSYFKRITKDHTHFSPALLKALWRQVSHYDLVHIHAWWNLVSVFSCLIAVMRGVPVILSPRGTLSRYSFKNRNAFVKRGIHNMLGKNLLKKVAVHATSVHEREILDGIVSAERITILPNLVALPVKKYPAKTVAPGILKLLFLSRIEQKKGLDLLFEALKQVRVPYHLSIAGGGEQAYIASLKEMADRYGISENITWLGFRGEDKFDILHDNHLMVLPSHDENFGNVVVESLCVGTPVLITENVGLATYVADKDLGWVCTLSPASIAENINNIGTTYRDKLNAITGYAPAIIDAGFTPAKLTTRYIDMYYNITNK